MKSLIATFCILILLAGTVAFVPGAFSEKEPRKFQSQFRKTNNVAIQSSVFNPHTLEISAGEKVTWVNYDAQTYKIESEMFEPKNISPGASFSHVFSEPGTYKYYAENFEGEIIVK